MTRLSNAEALGAVRSALVLVGYMRDNDYSADGLIHDRFYKHIIIEKSIIVSIIMDVKNADQRNASSWSPVNLFASEIFNRPDYEDFIRVEGNLDRIRVILDREDTRVFEAITGYLKLLYARKSRDYDTHELTKFSPVIEFQLKNRSECSEAIRRTNLYEDCISRDLSIQNTELTWEVSRTPIRRDVQNDDSPEPQTMSI